MGIFSSLQTFFSAIFPVKRRHVLTRAGKLRLRCYALIAACVLLVVSVLSVQVSVQARQGALPVELAAQDTEALSGSSLAMVSEGRALEQASPLALQPREKNIKIGKGDTLSVVLQKAGLSGKEAYAAVQAVQKEYDPRDLRIGQVLSFYYEPSEDGQKHELAGMDIKLDALRSVALTREGEAFAAGIKEMPVVKRLHTGQSTIQTSLYGSAERDGIPSSVIADAIHIYSWDVDFQRDIRRGDSLEVLYERFETEGGTPVKNGDLLYVRLNVNGVDRPVYRFEMPDGRVDYFMENGTSLRKALMKTPVDGARLSSGYGMRKHPILGYNKMHKGVDFAAPSGTPIYAAGDGVVERAGRYGAYGNYMRIRHNSTYKTAYAHLKGFAKNVRAGSRVQQGQVIGYVGSTGRSTGPHLHYEVIKNGQQVNPQTVKLPQGETLTGKTLAAFKSRVAEISKQYASLNAGERYAGTPKGEIKAR